MKKVSSVAPKQSRNISQPKLTIGLDLGDRNSWYCLVDEAGQIRLEQRIRTNAKALQEVFGAMPCCRIALETGTHSPWISRLLNGLGHEVALERFLPLGDTSFPMLGFIDLYGNTLFSGVQMQLFIPEWDRLTQNVTDEDDQKFFLKAHQMAERCRSQPHTFLRFVGD